MPASALKPTLVLFAAAFTGCSSMSLPDLGRLDGAFQKSQVDLSETPRPRDAPAPILDTRSDSDWDRAARELMALRDQLDLEPEAANAGLEREFDALAGEVRQYQRQDPPGLDRTRPYPVPPVEPFRSRRP